MLERIRRDIESRAGPAAALDARAVVLAVNESWRAFGRANGNPDERFGVGRRYLDECEAASGACQAYGIAAAQGIREVAAGLSERFVLDYPCHAPDEYRWYRLRVRPLGGSLLIAEHGCITERMLACKRSSRTGPCPGCGLALPLLRIPAGEAGERWRCARCGCAFSARLDPDCPPLWLERIERA